MIRVAGSGSESAFTQEVYWSLTLRVALRRKGGEEAMYTALAKSAVHKYEIQNKSLVFITIFGIRYFSFSKQTLSFLLDYMHFKTSKTHFY